jgi:hypothetical protein
VEGVRATDRVVKGLLYLFHHLHCGVSGPTAGRMSPVVAEVGTGYSPD